MAETNRPTPQNSMTAGEYLAIALERSEEVRKQAKVKLNVEYGTEDRQKIDLYLPDRTPTSQLPVFLFIHGGYWVLGHKDTLGFMAPAITCLPAIFVAVGYRLAPGTKYPGAVDDCRDAVKWAYENIADYGGDPERIFVGGHSAGGHLAALITLQRDSLKRLGLPKNVIKGCLTVSGIFDVADTPGERREAFLNTPEEATEASPLIHVAGNHVPFLLEIGEHDFPNLKAQHPVMFQALQQQPGRVEVMERPALNHFQISLDNGEERGAWAKKVRQWLADPPVPMTGHLVEDNQGSVEAGLP